VTSNQIAESIKLIDLLHKHREGVLTSAECDASIRLRIKGSGNIAASVQGVLCITHDLMMSYEYTGSKFEWVCFKCRNDAFSKCGKCGKSAHWGKPCH
jgi:hypothetical protein